MISEGCASRANPEVPPPQVVRVRREWVVTGGLGRELRSGAAQP